MSQISVNLWIKGESIQIQLKANVRIPVCINPESTDMPFQNICGINGHIAFPDTEEVPCMYMHLRCCVYRCPYGRYIEMCINCTIGQEAFHGMVFHYTQVTYFEGENDDLCPLQ